jgi:hypothetical protein
MTDRDGGLPVEQFIQALTSQLDRVQSTMAMKARAGLPMTFAVKDLSLDLRTHVDMAGSVVRIRPAGPGDADASILHLQLTTITAPMIQENTRAPAADPDEPSLQDVLGDEEDQRRLEWAGVHTVSQLRDLEREGGEQALQRVSQLPVARLRAALARAAEPYVSRVVPDWRETGNGSGGDATPLLRVRGRNLRSESMPRVRIDGAAVPVIMAEEDELLVRPAAEQLGGTLVVETGTGRAAAFALALAVPPPGEPAGEQPGAP